MKHTHHFDLSEAKKAVALLSVHTGRHTQRCLDQLIAIVADVPCNKCQGKGQIIEECFSVFGEFDCSSCGGTGKEYKD